MKPVSAIANSPLVLAKQKMIFSRYLAFISLALLSLASADVSCGGHRATSCERCPYDSNGNDKGRGWCNGECRWNDVNDKCETPPLKRCGGGSSAKICAECPSGEANCGNTDCVWHPNTSLCRDSFSDDVRTASVHLFYDKPIAQPAWWFQRVVPTASAQSTYFCTSQHRFGYGGIQEVNSSKGRVIFSIWDQGGCDQDVSNCNDNDIAKTIACGTGVTCQNFQGEGTGRQSIYDRAPFLLNQEYYFVTQAKYLGNKRVEYTGYFYENGMWRLLSRIQVSTNSDEEWWIHGQLASFVEQWLRGETTKDRGALFGPSYMADKHDTDFLQIKTARFSHGTLENHERVNAWQAGADWQHAVGIETGGNVVPVAGKGDEFTYPDYAPYEELTSFRENIDCLNLAQNKDEIEFCLFIPSPTAPTALPIAAPTNTDVNCGAHTAASCERCPYDSNGDDMGQGWCNGECVWNNADNMCAAPTEPTDAPTALLTDAPTAFPTVDLTDAPSMTPIKAPTSNSECVDTAFTYYGQNGKKTCAELLGDKPDNIIKQLCKKWDKHGRLVKNHCPKTCKYDCNERCADDDKFIIEHENTAYKCDDIPNSVITCTTLRKRQLVAEHCRKSCGICS